MNKIDILAEQTKFLFEKQQEVLAYFKEQFGALKKEVEAEQAKAEQVRAAEKVSSFQNVVQLLDSQEGESIKELEEDVAFVGEQYKAIEQIKQMDDPAQVEELTSMMLEEGHELTQTEAFKSEVEQEANEAMTNYRMMMDDIKAVLLEEGVEELESLLEAHAEARTREQEAAQEAHEDEGCQDESCKDESCKDQSCSPSSCSTCPGCNIFEGLEAKLEDPKDPKEE